MTTVGRREAVASVPRPVGAWRAAACGWRVFAPVVVVNAVVQSLTVVADPVPAVTVGFLALVAASAAALVLAVWCVVGAAWAGVDDRPRAALATVRSRPGIVAWTVGTGVVAVAASLLAVWLSPVVLVLGAFLLPPAAGGQGGVVAGAVATWRRHPVRALLLVVVGLVLAAASAVLALVLGLFVTGWLSAGLLWLWLGVTGTVLLCRYCVVADPTSARCP